MSNTLSFLVILGISGGSAGLIVAVLHRPLMRVITDLCGTEDRGRFWTAYAGVMIVLSPVLAVSFAMTVRGLGVDDPLFLQRSVFWSALALMMAMAAFGFVLWRPSHRLFEAKLAEQGGDATALTARKEPTP